MVAGEACLVFHEGFARRSAAVEEDAARYPLTIDPMRLNEITVLETVKDGQTVWRRE